MYKILSSSDPEALAEQMDALAQEPHTFISDTQFSTTAMSSPGKVKYSVLIRYEKRAYVPHRERVPGPRRKADDPQVFV